MVAGGAAGTTVDGCSRLFDVGRSVAARCSAVLGAVLVPLSLGYITEVRSCAREQASK